MVNLLKENVSFIFFLSREDKIIPKYGVFEDIMDYKEDWFLKDEDWEGVEEQINKAIEALYREFDSRHPLSIVVAYELSHGRGRRIEFSMNEQHEYFAGEDRLDGILKTIDDLEKMIVYTRERRKEK